MTRTPCEFVYITLPRPISTNALFSNRKSAKKTDDNGEKKGKQKGRIISKEYAAWKLECGVELMRQRPGCVEGAYALTIRVPATWSGDLDNATKSVSDLLQSHEVISNDKRAERILLERWQESFVQVLVVSTRESMA